MKGRPLEAFVPIVAAALLSCWSTLGHAQSFDCGRAKKPSERAICRDDNLSSLDSEMSDLFFALPERIQQDIRSEQDRWLKRRDRCGSKTECLESEYYDRINQLREYAASDSLPGEIGECAVTRITSIGSRLEGVPDSGISVAYENGGVQVSYDVIPGVRRSQVGDEVRLCLVSVPEDCPPGDDRGRVYMATNLRTQANWVAPDSQHMCGGA